MSIPVQYLGGSTGVSVPTPGGVFDFERGGKPVEVPDDVAGTEPGEWRRLAVDDDGNPVEEVPEHWHRAVDDEGFAVVQDPGSGLLAQHEQFARAKPAKASRNQGGGVDA